MRRAIAVLALSLFSLPAHADESAFHAGSVIPAFGEVASVEGAEAIPDGTVFKVSFDVNEPAEAGALNRGFVSAARFINMQAEHGVAPEDVHLAVVVHGGAVRDLLKNALYKEEKSADNANAALIAALAKKGVRFYACGQSAAYYDVAAGDLLPGATMAVSAMTAHALLQQAGYTLNPF